jgi:hypothetical protein
MVGTVIERAPAAAADPQTVSAIRGHQVGRIVGVRAGRWLVDYLGNPHGPLGARTTLPVDADALRRAATAGAEALLVFEQERSDRPVVVGLVTPTPPEYAPAEPDAAGGPVRTEARVDGRHVVVEAEDEIVLRCGEASITLRRNGRVVIRGAYVETRARGVNRVKGGSVQIN